MQDYKEKDMEEAAPENKLTLDSLAARFLLLKTTFDFFYSLAPCMIQTLKLKPLVEGLVPNWNIFREVEKQNLDRNLQINLSLKLRLFPLPPPPLSAPPSAFPYTSSASSDCHSWLSKSNPSNPHPPTQQKTGGWGPWWWSTSLLNKC